MEHKGTVYFFTGLSGAGKTTVGSLFYQRLKNTKTLIIGFLLIIMGCVMLALSQLFGGTEIQDFLSGFMLGISISEMLIGVFLLGRYLARRNEKN